MMANECVEPSVSYSVEVMDMWRTYGLGSKQEVTALRGVNLRLGMGRFALIKGRSGSGKSTLLNCVGGLDRPTSGAALVFGRDLSTLSEEALTKWRREQIGFVFQSFGLSPTYTAYENVELRLRISAVPYRERHERAMYCLDLVGLNKWRSHRPDEMSGGQQQRLAIARALANRPKLLLADEPTGELDSVTAREILGLFRKVVEEEEVTILIASHDPLVEEFVQEVYELHDGRIISPE
jgi:putative ABC transport system ATP-binding protein